MKKINLFVEFNTYCNYKCLFCNNPNLEKHQYIDINQIKGLSYLETISNYIDITGYGEFTVHPHFDDIVNYFSKSKIPMRLVTNGSKMINKEVRDILSKLNWSDFIVSLNSLNKDTYSKLSGNKGNLDSVMEGLFEWRSMCSKVGLSFVMNKMNWNEIDDILNFSKKYDIRCAMLGLTPTISHIYTDDIKVESTDENKKIVLKARERIEKEKIKAYIFNFDTQEENDRIEFLKKNIRTCKWVDEDFFILVNGEVHVCCWNHHNMGNIKEKNFSEIFYGKDWNLLRNNIRNGVIEKNCMNCRGLG